MSPGRLARCCRHPPPAARHLPPARCPRRPEKHEGAKRDFKHLLTQDGAFSHRRHSTLKTRLLISRQPSLAGPALTLAPNPAPSTEVLSGAVTYAQSRLVVLAHHSEDTAWADSIGRRDGSGSGGAAATIVVEVYSDSDSPPPGAKPMPPGKGKEARAYLKAILDHWDSLPDAIAFLHAHNSSKHTVVGGRSPAKLGAWNSSEWRLTHLSWAADEYYVPLSVGAGGGGGAAWLCCVVQCSAALR